MLFCVRFGSVWGVLYAVDWVATGRLDVFSLLILDYLNFGCLGFRCFGKCSFGAVIARLLCGCY